MEGYQVIVLIVAACVVAASLVLLAIVALAAVGLADEKSGNWLASLIKMEWNLIRSKELIAYPPLDEEVDVEARIRITTLLGFINSELKSSRARQSAIFRDTVIAIALVTWAVIISIDKLSSSTKTREVIGLGMAFFCIYASLQAARAIFVYRGRICRLCDRREDLIRRIRPRLAGEDTNVPATTWLFPTTGAPTQSSSYAACLFMIGVLAAVVNLSTFGPTGANNGKDGIQSDDAKLPTPANQVDQAQDEGSGTQRVAWVERSENHRETVRLHQVSTSSECGPAMRWDSSSQLPRST